MQHHPGFLKLVASAQLEVNEITIEELNQQLLLDKTLTLIDCREESEWNLGHIPQAIHLGRGIIERDIEAKIFDQSRPLVIYCGGGYRSILASYNLKKMGYSKVYSLQEGYRGWLERKLLIEI